MKKLTGKWALVTGSTRGIGWQVAQGLAQHGCKIILHGRNEEACQKRAAELQALGIETFCAPGDLADSKGVESVIEVIRNAGISPDILYNNAGSAECWKDESFLIPRNDWEKLFSINLFALVRLCSAFAPEMKKKGWGRIVNVSSGIKDVPQLAPYGASKAAVDKYTQDLAFELKDTGVLVNYLDPGWLKTDLGGEHADFEVETVLPGALIPVLQDDRGETARLFKAQDLRGLSIEST